MKIINPIKRFDILLPVKENIKFFFIISLLASFYPLKTLFCDFNLGDCMGVLLGISTAMTWAYIGCIVIFLAGRIFRPLSRYVKILLYIVSLLIITTSLVITEGFGRYVSPVELQLIGETNLHEMTGFFSTFTTDPTIALIFVSAIIVIAAIVFIEKCNFRAENYINRWGDNLSGVFIFCIAIGCINLFHVLNLGNSVIVTRIDDGWRHALRYADGISKITHSYSELLATNKELDRWIDINRAVRDTHSVSEEDLKIVFIIGESHIKHHTNLYGYPVETYPYLTKEYDNGNLHVFTNVVSAARWTTVAVRNLLSTNDSSSPEMEEWHAKPYLPYLFNQAKWDVYFWDNQTVPPGESDPSNFSLTAYLMNQFMRDSCYTYTYTRTYTYDDALVEDYKNVFETKDDGRSLSVIHLKGQHFAPSYPDNFDRFKASDYGFRTETWMTDEKKKEIARYDNVHLYNDYVLAQVIDIFRDKNAVIVYVSDHGEEAYDYRDSFGRKECAENPEMATKYQNEVPLFVWISDTWKERHPEMNKALSDAVDKPLLADNICQLIMKIGGIKSEFYIPSRDVTDSTYHCNPRLINNRTVNYDTLSVSPKVP